MSKLSLLSIAIFLIIITASSQTTYQVKNSITLNNEDCVFSRLILIMPLPASNIYQTVYSLDYAAGEAKKALNNENKYLREDISSNLPPAGNSHTLSYDFKVALYPMYIDMKQFKTLYPYDVNSDDYKKYTISQRTYIDLLNPGIRETADKLWADSKGNIIDYAYACYLYAAGNFNYINPNTGIHPIAQILAEGGGDCGNLSSIFINLLRVKGIPARHLVMVRPNGSYHVTADFYLEKYGWIPVDVTMKHDYPSGDYFGYHAGDGIIMSIDLCSQIESYSTNTYEAVILQNYYYWYWWSVAGKLSSQHTVNSKLVSRQEVATLKSIGSRSVTIKCEAYEGISHFSVKLYKAGNMEKEYRFENSGDFTIDNLLPETNYTVYVTACRNVGNIETTMGTSHSLSFKTALSPVSAENAISGISIRTENRQLFILVDEQYTATIYSAQGQLVLISELHEGNNILALNRNGIYILKLTDRNKKEYIKKVFVR